MRIGIAVAVAGVPPAGRRTVMPLVATMIGALLPEARTSRLIQPSKPRPLVITTLASATFLASAGAGA